jgi:hypothetical protein
MELKKIILEFENGEIKEITDDPENLLSDYGKFLVKQMNECTSCYQREMRPVTGLMGEMPEQFTKSQDE